MLFVVLGAAVLDAQPFIFYRGILNAASFAPQGLPGGSIFSRCGHNLGPPRSGTVAPFPLGTAFHGVSIEVCETGYCAAGNPPFVSGEGRRANS